MPVILPCPPKTAERLIWITPDGITYPLESVPERIVASIEGEGMPPIDYVTQRGPYQHGESLRDYFLKPRVVQMVIRHKYTSRAAYWAGRTTLLDMLRPNRLVAAPAQGTLRKLEPDGTTRDLTCIIQQGPTFTPKGNPLKGTEWDEWSYTETLKFLANNPIWFDPVSKSVSMLPVSTPTFPISFPVSFVGFSLNATIVYGGNWQEFPTILINGPFSGLTITNTTTGDVIGLQGSVLVGQSVTIALAYGSKTVTLNDGTNMIGLVTPNSDLALWHFQPGNNIINVSGSLTGAATSVQFTWFNRYIGI